jgi:hypothetical protein
MQASWVISRTGEWRLHTQVERGAPARIDVTPDFGLYTANFSLPEITVVVTPFLGARLQGLFACSWQ